jgi:hypothetical protein
MSPVKRACSRKAAGKLGAVSPAPLGRAGKAQGAALVITRKSASLFVPWGRSIIAQQFTAGDIDKIERILSPVGTVEGMRRGRFSIVPTGRAGYFFPHDPAMNRWAIFKRPYGAIAESSLTTCV